MYFYLKNRLIVGNDDLSLKHTSVINSKISFIMLLKYCQNYQQITFISKTEVHCPILMTPMINHSNSIQIMS